MILINDKANTLAMCVPIVIQFTDVAKDDTLKLWCAGIFVVLP